MAAPETRDIDRLPSASPRPKDMQVLCLRLSRTATMYFALERLGYKAYHFKEIGQRDIPGEPPHVKFWHEAFVAKMYGRGKTYGKEEFNKLLRNYSAVTDAPSVCFSNELKAYPDAKVILSNQDVDKWLASMESNDHKWFRALTAIVTTHDDWTDREALRKTFHEHYAHIREIVPRENILEWAPQDGYEPICKFLGKPVPGEPFPHINKGDSVAEIHKNIGYIGTAKLLGQYLRKPVLYSAVVLGAWWYTKRMLK
ncbi:hypothetical protein BGZ60DRAFT_379684 [Tricladium varicosporioides]|nr:hypothetical protein BGZ60DRAFT_379684 [Hymenoscyphus varicosporioides]